ncbi:MFS transporter [Pantoea sp. 1.19]|uniref:MFS transporter n=1 Tax=Pantoea sp. 1.19 TaxID=1925589 RepID=UPI000948A939|nr:MFS transporter [Pantoea sp. 1.19]
MQINVTDRFTSAPARQIATRAIFFIAGMGMSAWAPLVPYARDRTEVNDASLGALLLFLGVGSLLTMPMTGALVARYGCRRVIVSSVITLLVALPLLAWLATPLTLALALMLFGAALGLTDVAMNIQAVAVEKAAGRPMMSGFHGFFSLGGIAGAALVSTLLWLGFTPLTGVLSVMLIIGLLLALSCTHLLNDKPAQSGDPLFVLPRGWVLFLGLLTFVLFLSEGAILDWSALFLSEQRQLASTEAGLGYALFSVTMTVGRLTGDRVVAALGRPRVLAGGSLLAAVGMALAAGGDSVASALLGFMLVGFGAANSVPILFTAAGNQQAMPANQAIAAMTTVGYTGILAGPALIGFISHAAGLQVAFSLLAALLLFVAASARSVTR